MYKETGGGEDRRETIDRLKDVLCSKNIWHHREFMADPDVREVCSPGNLHRLSVWPAPH